MIPVIYPMGAKSDDKRVEIAWDSPDYYAERKYDGSRYLVRIENGKVRFTSRQKSKKTGLPVDKTENVPHLAEMFGNFPDGTVFDGEIITHENCTSNDVTSIMGSLPEEALAKQKERGFVKYVVFDVLFYDGTDFRDQPYKLRRAAVEKLIGGLSNFGFENSVFPAPVVKENKRAFHDKIIEGGGEGTILKNINKPYIVDKKPTDTWLKVKKYDTFDVVVVGYTKPTKEYTGGHLDTWTYFEDGIAVTKDYAMGWIGAVKFAQWLPAEKYVEKRKNSEVPTSTQTLTFDGVVHHLVEIGQTDGLSDEWKEEFTRNGEKYMNAVIEVGAMEQLSSTTGALRHPRFLQVREDKQSRECIFGEY